VRNLLITITHFNDEARVNKFLAHTFGLALPQDCRLFVAVADNSLSWQGLGFTHPNLEVFRPQENLGYLRGCAFAFENWVAKNREMPEWTLISNTDVTLADDFFQNLMTIELSDEVGVLAPDVRLPDDYPQNPYRLRRPSRLRMYSYVVIYRSVFLTALYDLAGMIKRTIKAVVRGFLAESASRQIPSVKQIYAPHGSVVILNRRFFEKGGNLQHGGKMFFEEFHIAEEARRIGLKVAYIPTLKVKHFPHSTVKFFGRGARRLWAYESALAVWKMYFASSSA